MSYAASDLFCATGIFLTVKVKKNAILSAAFKSYNMMLAISRILHLSNRHITCAAVSPPVITEWFLFWECFMAQLGVLLGKLK